MSDEREAEAGGEGPCVLLLYLKTGGGHQSTARSIAEALSDLAGGKAHVYLEDAIPPDGRVRRFVLEDGYRFFTTKRPWLWKLLYDLTFFPPIMSVHYFLMRLSCASYIERLVREKKPDIVINLHFLLSNALRRAVKKAAPRTKRLTVVTDPFSVHDCWFKELDEEKVVTSARAMSRALEMGAKPDSTFLFPYPLSRRYDRGPGPDEIALARKRLGLSSDERFVLISAGGDGMPGLDSFVSALADSRHEFTIGVVCGRNATLKEGVEAVLAKKPQRKALVFGFVDFMPELIASSYVVITKAGPASIFECLIMEAPPIIPAYHYGQEKGNVLFLLENRVGWYEPEPSALAARVEELIERPELLAEAKNRIRALGLKNGAADIAKHAIERTREARD
jgi:processive 1,2-diacylglycerol beta-glucosyltransferase/1,2-diacylglycerol 3-beta-galactosyltransferase